MLLEIMINYFTGCASAPLRSAPPAHAPLLAGARRRCAQQDIPNPYIKIRMVNK